MISKNSAGEKKKKLSARLMFLTLAQCVRKLEKRCATKTQCCSNAKDNVSAKSWDAVTLVQDYVINLVQRLNNATIASKSNELKTKEYEN